MPQRRAILAKLTFGLIKPEVSKKKQERARRSNQLRAEAVQRRAGYDKNYQPPPQPPGGAWPGSGP